MPDFCISFGKAVIKDSDNMLKKVLEILEKNQCFGQIANAKAIVSEKHCLYAVEQTISAFEQGSNFAKRKEIELLLRLSGRKQLEKALQAVGVKEGKAEQEIMVIAVGENSEKAVKEIEEFLKLKKAKFKPDLKALKEIFGIPESEKRIEDAVLEKSAMIALED
jgi:tRNA threonylcarbamoyladenosine modification (KEOPS) complex Cgi121 subunit